MGSLTSFFIFQILKIERKKYCTYMKKIIKFLYKTNTGFFLKRHMSQSCAMRHLVIE